MPRGIEEDFHLEIIQFQGHAFMEVTKFTILADASMLIITVHSACHKYA